MQEDTKTDRNDDSGLSGLSGLSGDQLRLMISSVKDYAIFMLDPQGNVLSWNKGAEKIKGYKDAEIVGKHFSAFYPTEDLQKGKPERELKEATAKGRFEDEGWRLRKDGSPFWANVVITPVYNEAKVLQGFTKVTRDLTERKKAEGELNEAQHQLRLMIASVGDYAIFMLDPQGNILSWNKGAENIKGYKEKEIVGKHFSNFYPPEDIKNRKPDRELKEAIAKGRMEDEGWRLRKDGSRFWANVVITPVYDETGVLIGFSKVTRDLTERKIAEEGLRDTQQNLLHSNRMGGMTRLAGVIAQEFDSMMKAITRQTKLVTGSLEEGSQLRQRVEEIGKIAENASNLNNQLLAFSSAQVLNPKLLDLNIVVSSIRGTLQWLIGKNIELITKLSPHIGWVNMDPFQMENIIINLAGRARETIGSTTGTFIIETTNLSLKTSIPHTNGIISPGKYVVMRVSDTGPALEKEAQTRIFEPFFKMETGGKETGLKLSTIYGIVKQSGGQILVNSENGRGTTFEIYLNEDQKT